MRNISKDVAMVFIALLLTGGMAHAMQPTTTQRQAQQVGIGNTAPREAPVARVSSPKPVATVQPQPEPAPTPPPAPQPVAAPEPVKAPAPVDDGSAKMFIYMHESGNNPASTNASGCRGLGQACPGSKLPCGADYACQDAWFTNYMLGRYGTWENAKASWLSRCGGPLGCWW